MSSPFGEMAHNRVMETFGTRLRNIRTQKGLSLQKLAEFIKSSDATISAWERDVKRPHFDMLIALADFFDESLDYIMRGKI